MSSDPTNEPFQISVAPEAVEVGEDHLVFPGGVLFPLSARGSGVLGMPDRPWSRLSAEVFYTNPPSIYSLALWREPPDVLQINLKATFFLSQAVARVTLSQGGGKIINIASMLSFQGGITVPSYTAAKSALAGVTRALANEWA